MALIKCPECEKEISDKAKSCPHCGYPLDDKKYCPRCGKAMKDDFCTNCGYPKTFQQPQQVVQPIQIQPKKKDSNALSPGANAWLIIATILCIITGILNLVFFFNVYFILYLQQGIALINIRHQRNKFSIIYFYIISILLILLNIMQTISGTNIADLLILGVNVLLILINIVVTTLVIKGKLKKNKKTTASGIVLLVVSLIVSIIISLLFNLIFRKLMFGFF